MRTDETLWDDFQAGDQSALAELIGRYREPVTRYIAGHGVKAPEDTAQEVFLTLTRYTGTLEGLCFKPWVYSVACRLAKEQQAADREARLASPELESLAEAFQR